MRLPKPAAGAGDAGPGEAGAGTGCVAGLMLRFGVCGTVGACGLDVGSGAVSLVLFRLKKA